MRRLRQEWWREKYPADARRRAGRLEIKDWPEVLRGFAANASHRQPFIARRRRIESHATAGRSRFHERGEKIHEKMSIAGPLESIIRRSYKQGK
jgi:hypothetical protein